MRTSVIWHVFRKDGIELLRDRRTIFVNVVLPVLLYPVMALFMLQAIQLTQPGRADVPRIALIDAPTELIEAIPQPDTDQEEAPAEPAGDPATKAEDATQEVADEPTENEARLPERGAAAPDYNNSLLIAELETSTVDQLRELFAEIASSPRQQTGDDTQASHDPDFAVPDELRERCLGFLRQQELAAATLVETRPDEDMRDGFYCLTLVDNAHRHHLRVVNTLGKALGTFSDAQVELRLADAGLEAAVLEPLDKDAVDLAKSDEANLSKMAGIIPLLLIIMAVSGSFLPALDLIAGERERGTLETLLCWPGGRQEIFLGKLLVVVAAAAITVALNLLSLGITFQIFAGQALQNGAGSLSIGLDILLLSFLVLLPLVVTLAAVSLSLAGIAASFKEAQNYLSPLFLVVFIPSMVVMLPNAKPTVALDLLPIVGPLLALKEGLQAPEIPWGHLFLATGASTVLTLVVVNWAVRLLEDERFLYPGMVKAGWGRWRQWGEPPATPSGLEVMGVFAVATGAFLVIGPAFQDFHPALALAAPLVCCILAPALLHTLLGAYRWRDTLSLGQPSAVGWLVTLLLWPCALALSLSIGDLQTHFLGEMPLVPGLEKSEQGMQRILDDGGIALLVLCAAVAPGICEEILCRGSLLAGLRRGLGPAWAVLVSAFCFAVLHGMPWRFFPQFVLGVMLAVLVLRSGSIWPAVLIHILHNASLVVVASWWGPEFEELLTGTSDGIWLAVLVTALVVSAGLLRLIPIPAARQAASPA